MENIVELHEALYRRLMELRNRKHNLNFTFRKSNHAGRLEEGYWFYGNENYLAVSFWTGMDWKNRTPNIIFIIDSNGNCSLEINVSDSSAKKEFVELYMLDDLNLVHQGRKYVKKYDKFESPINIFAEFLNNDKVTIDNIIRNHGSRFFDNSTSGELNDQIGFITDDEFLKRHNKVKQYRRQLQIIQDDDQFNINEEKPNKISAIQLENYGLIKNVEITVDSKKNQWIFITGNNGSGKTNLLRGIATVLGQRLLSKEELIINSDFKSKFSLIFKNREIQSIRNGNNEAKGKKRPLVQGLAMYGPYRLDVSEKSLTKLKLKQELNKEGSFKPLFKAGVPLLNIDNQFNLWRSNKTEREKFKKRTYYFKSVLTDIVPGLVNVIFGENNSNSTQYVFVYNEGEPEYPVIWKDLPSGIKSIIAMLGDILIRLYDQQSYIDDPAEFKGIVIIDEIDLHLHPQGQRDLIVNLSRTFPNLQFIVTTHSPIPLLGAPDGSVFYRVHRNVQDGVFVERLDVKISNLLPNSILSSPIFDFDSYINNNYDKTTRLRTEKDYDDVVFYSILEKKIREKSLKKFD